MSNDPLMDHLEMQSDMHDRCFTPGQYATTKEQDAEIDAREQQEAGQWLKAKLAAIHSQLYVTAIDQIPYQGEPGLEANKEIL